MTARHLGVDVGGTNCKLALVESAGGRPLDQIARVFTRPKVSLWAFQRYLDIAPPSFAVPAPPAAAVPAATERAA